MLAEVKDLYKRYNQLEPDRQKPVLDGISLSINTGESIAVTGPSGSGKTTLLNMFGTLDRPDAGRILLNGLDPFVMKEDELAALRNSFIGFVFQLHYLLPQLSLLENVLLPALPLKDPESKRSARERAGYLITKMGLSSMSHRKPAELSVGECQRAAVARALVNKPAILLADEPTGSLDSETAETTGRLLASLKQEEGLAMLVVTHSPVLASLMDREYRLSAGKLSHIR